MESFTSLRTVYCEVRSWDPIYQAALAASVANVFLTVGITVTMSQPLWLFFTFVWVLLGGFVLYVHR